MGEEVFIDTNIFLEIFLDQENADNCEQFLKHLGEVNEQPVTSDFVVYSSLVAIERNLKSVNSLRNAIIFFTNYSGLHVLRPTLEDAYLATKFIVECNLDFDDSLVVSCMKNNGIKKIVSLDKHFDRVNGVERIKP